MGKGTAVFSVSLGDFDSNIRSAGIQNVVINTLHIPIISRVISSMHKIIYC